MAGSHTDRAASSRPLWVAALGIVGVMVVGGLIGLALALVATSDQDPDPSSGAAETSASPTPSPTFSATTPPPSPSSEPLDLARDTKPLQALERGDRVLYDANPARPVCTWLLWAGSIATSRIQCGAETFEVETGFLTPVERLP